MSSNNINSTLPRSMTVSNRSLHNPYQTSSLRRNVSMTNINDNTNGHHYTSSLKNSSTSNLSQSQSSFQVGSCIKYTPLRWISKFVGQFTFMFCLDKIIDLQSWHVINHLCILLAIKTIIISFKISQMDKNKLKWNNFKMLNSTIMSHLIAKGT